MAFALVQGGDRASGTGSSIVVTVTTPTVAGNLVVIVTRSATSQVLNSVSDDAGNTYVVMPSQDISTFRQYMAYGVQTASATAITATWAASGVSKTVETAEFSGGASSNAAVYDTTSTGTGTGTSCSVSTFSPAASGELIVVGLDRGTGTDTWVAGSGYTLTGDSTVVVTMEHKLSSGTSETAPASFGSSKAWSLRALAFKPAGGASVSSGFFLLM